MVSAPLFIYILILHYLGDYIFQPYWLSVQKSESQKMLLYHVFIYTSVLYLGLIFVVELKSVLVFSGITFALHYIVDFVTSRVISDNSSSLVLDPDASKPVHKRLKLWGPISLLGFDQLLHQACLLIAMFVAF
jgi:hypothetical protein